MTVRSSLLVSKAVGMTAQAVVLAGTALGGCVGTMSSSGASGTEALCEASFAASLHGRVIDEAGAAVIGAQVQACITSVGGNAFCLEPVASQADGTFEIAVPEDGRCFEDAVVRITRPGEAGRWATTYCSVEGALEGDALSLSYDATVVELPAPLSMPPIGAPSAMRTVLFSGGLSLTLSPSSLVREDAYPLLRARSVSVSAAPCSIGAPADVRFDGLVAFGPEVEVDGEVELGVPVAAAEGSTVELFTIGGTYTVLDGAPIPEGRFARLGTGTVVGGRVGVSGLPILSWVGYRVIDGTIGTSGASGAGTSGAGTSGASGAGTSGTGTSGTTELPPAGSCPATTSGREVGDVVAALSFPTTEGGTFAVRDHCEDELVVVYHYVDGCGSCAAFLSAEGNALADELASHGHRFVVAVARVNDLDGASRAATVADAQRIQEELGLTMTVVADEGSTLLSTFSRSGPSYLLALRRGNVIAQPWAGYGTRVPETVRALMTAIESE